MAFRTKVHPVCRRCKVRWVQRDGLCRACGRELGVYDLSTFQADAMRVARQQARTPAVSERLAPAIRTRVINGIEYDVVFDGSVRDEQ